MMNMDSLPSWHTVSSGCPLKVSYSPNARDLQGTFRLLLGDQQKIDDLMKTVLLDAIVLVLHIYYCFLLERQIFKKSKCGRPRDVPGTNDGMLWGCPWDVGHTCFLKLTQKHIKPTLTGYSRLYSEL